MERIIRLSIELLPEGVYLATSDDVQGLLAQGRTIQETVEIARDVARALLEIEAEDRGEPAPEPPLIERVELPIVIAA